MSGELWRPDPATLAAGQAPVYIATKLFDYAGRMLSAAAEEALVRGIRRGLAEQGLRSAGNLAFLPFRDSNEAIDPELSDAGLVTEQIYQLDIAAIRRSYAVVALLNDPQKDSGVCFEVGYAAALGRPIMPVVNDFIDYRYDPWEWVYPLDPVICAIAPAILKEATLPTLGAGDRRRLYRRAQDTGITALQERLASAGSELVRAPGQFMHPLPEATPSGVRPRVHLEFGGGLFEWQRLLGTEALRVLHDAGLPCDVTIARRYEATGQELGDATHADIAAALGADVVVTLGDGADMDAGSAAIQGLARGAGRQVVLYYSGAVRWVTASRDPEDRNLMLQQSADALVRSLRDLPGAIQRLLPA
ncbi:MAG: nucleoside 2-deoxyribosyltransferase [Thermomicrobiales bacterium]